MCANETQTSQEDVSLRNLIVNDEHGLIYCYVPKAACTNWKRVMYVLKQNRSGSYMDPFTISREITHSLQSLTYLQSLPKAEIEAKLKHYTKFLFVRDPFVRLISAYKDKFVGTNEVFYHNYGIGILQRYAHMPNPPYHVKDAFMLGIRPTFNHFIKYLLDPLTEKNYPYDEHWRQIHRLCHPCFIQYDFIGHIELCRMTLTFC
ncbi:hypothetical protein WMY93_027630 [Mugilogobius chulae]|uniref:Carbohydrate sulfotransferase n=1 Tax=Mugilogobius chulae TaxID=88201 RepID=A0AAW0MZA9_9GOBI